MKARIIVLVLFIAAIAAVPLYILRDTHEARLRRWREASRFFFQDLGDLRIADELNRRVLELLPKSSIDRYIRALILERRGTTNDLRQSLALFEELAQPGGGGTPTIRLHQARIYRKLGDYYRAQGAAVSVIDHAPFEATLDMGLTSLSALSPQSALVFFRRAKSQFAKTDAHRALVDSWIAKAHAQRLEIEAMTSDEERERVRGEVRAAYASARRHARNVAETFSQPDHYFWLATLAESQSEWAAPGETPLLDTLRLVEVAASDKPNEFAASKSFQLRLGSLLLKAAWKEVDSAPETEGYTKSSLEERGVRSLLGAIDGLPASEGAELVRFDPSDEFRENLESTDIRESERHEKWRNYVLSMIAISKLFLLSPDHERLLADDSALALADRVADAGEATDREVADIFTLVRAFGFLKAGRGDEADALFQRYIDVREPDERPLGYVLLAEQTAHVFPSEGRVLRFLDAFDTAIADPLAFLDRRLRLLVAAANDAVLSGEARPRLKRTIASASAAAKSLSEVRSLVQVLRNIGRTDDAIALVERAQNASPDNPSLALLLGELLGEKFRARTAGRDETVRVLKGYLRLFLERPGRSAALLPHLQDVLRYARLTIPGLALEEVLKDRYPAAEAASLASFGLVVSAFLEQDFSAALALVERIGDRTPFDPMLGFIEASSLLQTARRTANGDQRASLTERAKQKFEATRALAASRLELVQLRLAAAVASNQVTAELVSDLRRELKEIAIPFQSNWLLAQTLDAYSNTLVREGRVGTPEGTAILDELVTTARATIQARPSFSAGYPLLASALVRGAEQKRAALLTGEDRALYARASAIVRSAPLLTPVAVTRLARYADRIGDSESARRYLVALGTIHPTEALLRSIVELSVRTGRAPEVRRLLADEFDRAATAPLKEAQESLVQRVGAATESSRFEESWRAVLALVAEAEASSEWAGVFPTILRGKFSPHPWFEPSRLALLAQVYVEENRSTPREDLRNRIFGYFERAVAAFESRGPVPIGLLNNYAWELSADPSTERRELAVNIAKTALDLSAELRSRGTVHDTYAWSLYKVGRLEDSEREYERLLEFDDRPVFRFHLATVLYDLGEYRRAQEHVQALEGSVDGIDFDLELESLRRKLFSKMREERELE